MRGMGLEEGGGGMGGGRGQGRGNKFEWEKGQACSRTVE